MTKLGRHSGVLSLFVIVAWLLVSVIQAGAEMVTVQNPSFEDFVFATDGSNTVGGVGLTGFGWTVTGGTKVGVFRPGSIFFNEPPEQVRFAPSAPTTAGM